MSDRVYYLDFQRVIALQYDPSVDGIDEAFCALLNTGSYGRHASGEAWWEFTGPIGPGTILGIFPGQWLVRFPDVDIVTDEEPPYAVSWQEHTCTPGCEDVCPQRRPILSNGWTGPWECATDAAMRVTVTTGACECGTVRPHFHPTPEEA